AHGARLDLHPALPPRRAAPPDPPPEGEGALEARRRGGPESEARARPGPHRPGAGQVIVTGVDWTPAHPSGTVASPQACPLLPSDGSWEGVDGDGGVLGGGGTPRADLFPVPAVAAAPVPPPAGAAEGSAADEGLAHGLARRRRPRRGGVHRGEAPEQPPARLPTGQARSAHR